VSEGGCGCCLHMSVNEHQGTAVLVRFITSVVSGFATDVLQDVRDVRLLPYAVSPALYCVGT
jgi:hypothetical protein